MASAAVIDVNEQTFEQEVIARSHEVPVVVDFWAAWCGPCRTLGPTLERLANAANGSFVLAKVDVDSNQRLAQTFRVQGIPAVKAFRNGQLIDQFEGALPESQVRAWLKRLVPSEADELVAAAQALERSDPEAAIGRYRLALGAQPDHAAAQFGLGRMLLGRGEQEGTLLLQEIAPGTPFYARAKDMLELSDFFAAAHGVNEQDLAAQTQNSSANSETRYGWAAWLAAQGRYQEAMEHLLLIVERDRAFRSDGARRALLGVFGLVGNDDPLVATYRQKLASALF